MKKEQTLLVVCAGIAALVAWSASGLYEPVQAAQIPNGSRVEVQATSPANPLWGCDRTLEPGRNLFLEQRTVVFDVFPDLTPPLPRVPQFPWIRPIPWPDLPPETWSLLRDPMSPVARPEKPGAKEEEESAKDPEEEDPEVLAAQEAEQERARQAQAVADRKRKVARLVYRDGKEILCRLIPMGADQGQPVWVILEKWPNVEFLVEELNTNDAQSMVGKYPMKPSENDKVATVHLEKTLENEYHEERIRRGVRPDNRQANIDFAQWIRTDLAVRGGYGVQAVRLALKHLDVAKSLQPDLALVLQIGEACQEAFDVDEEIRQYLEYLTGARSSDTSVIVRLGDAYERAGALHAAKEQFDRAATLGDAEARVRLAQVMLRLAEGRAELTAALDEFSKAQAAAQKEQRARAQAGMARVQLLLGNVPAALQLANDARGTDPASFEVQVVLGVAQYASGKWSDAERSFAAAAALERRGSTRARTDGAMAKLAQDRLDEAVADAAAALAADALNYFDPFVVQGEALQRWGDLTGSNDMFQTAAQRAPRNPWILLRLAAIRLRDGLPQQALELLKGDRGLLELAPGSVDALHVAGLACAGQEQPLWDDAVKYLRRALQKEPRNVTVIYDLARTLYAAGRTDDAIALLRRATDSNDGVAKNDARVLALLAYCYFDGPHLVPETQQTLLRARNANPEPWVKAWLDEVQGTINRWYNTRVWLDSFERTSGDVRNGWAEAEGLGVLISCDGTGLVMAGQQSRPAADRPQYTGVARKEELYNYQESTVVLVADPGFEFVVHLWAGEPAPANVGEQSGGRRGGRGNFSELGIGRDRTGRMMLYTYAGGTALYQVPVKDAEGNERMWPNDGAAHSVTFQRLGTAAADMAKGMFRILVDGEEVPTPAPIEIGTLSASSGGRSASFGVHVDGDPGAAIRLRVESVEIKRVIKR